MPQLLTYYQGIDKFTSGQVRRDVQRLLISLAVQPLLAPGVAADPTTAMKTWAVSDCMGASGQ